MVRLPKNRPPTHPGKMLQEEFLVPLGISQSEAARRLGVSFPRLHEIVKGQRGGDAGYRPPAGAGVRDGAAVLAQPPARLGPLACHAGSQGQGDCPAGARPAERVTPCSTLPHVLCGACSVTLRSRESRHFIKRHRHLGVTLDYTVRKDRRFLRPPYYRVRPVPEMNDLGLNRGSHFDQL